LKGDVTVRYVKTLFGIGGFLVFAMVLSVANAAAGTITAAQAKAHVGQSETVCGRVASTHYSAEGRKPTFLNLDEPYPHEIFTIVIWGADRNKFGQPEEKYRDRTVCVTGTIRSYRGVPEIIARELTQIRMEQPEAASRQQSDEADLGCDASLRNHVYHPGRLEVKEQCLRITGTIELVRREPDGDDHIRVKLDPPYANLINNENVVRQDGDLVVEPVCENPVTQADAAAACRDFHSDITVPPVGSHVTIVGS
jgi:hypothetical protein